jgi:CRISPR-associated protein Csx3
MQEEGIEASVQLVLHPDLPMLYRICRVKNTGSETIELDWLHGQDIGLADTGALKSNEAYVCQYLDHKILVHPVAGKTVLSRNNLHPRHPLALSFCLQGARSASTDGYQFFGTSARMDGAPIALGFQTLEDRVRQYEFAYTALQSRKIQLQPCQAGETVFAMYLMPEHPGVSSADDLALIDEMLRAGRPEPGRETAGGSGNAFFARAPLLEVQALDNAELEDFFEGPWRHTEYSDRHELCSFFCGDDTHVVFPAKEAMVERPHGSILKTDHGAELDENVLCVTGYGCGAFGSQLSLGNTAFGRFTTIQRNALNLERSSGIRIFAAPEKEGAPWIQLGFPSVFVMERDRIRWIYKTGDCIFEVAARASAETIEYSAAPLRGTPPALRITLEVCGDANEFDNAPAAEWSEEDGSLTIHAAPGSMLKKRFPRSCLVARLDGGRYALGGAGRIGGSGEPYVVIDAPDGTLNLSFTGHYEGRDAALRRFGQAGEPGWDRLTAGFCLSSGSRALVTLSDTIKWYAHNAMIHFAAPRGLEQYSGAAWGTRDVCQGPLEFLLALGHDRVAADMLCEVFAHQFADTGTWPQWFMFDGFAEIRQDESHGDIVFWPIKALCDYIEATGDIGLLEKEVAYADCGETASLHGHLRKALEHIIAGCVDDTALPSYGDGDWNDSLQPANQAMKTHMVSGWTVGLAYQSLSALARVWEKAGRTGEAAELARFLGRMHDDFRRHILKDGVAAGFVLFDRDETRHMLHPSDTENGIRYRLLPINRSIISELFDPAEKDDHLELVDRYLKFPDGVRLMDRPPEYTGGKSIHFQRAETASHFGREIGLQYVHAHIRYCEALAKVGRADELLEGLLTVSPVAIRDTVANARPRQANLYFSSSDADVYNRYEASLGMDELKKGHIGALGGWRLYSSGPGIYIGLVINRLFGIRRSFGRIVIDPVLPRSLDKTRLDLKLSGGDVQWIFHVEDRAHTPVRVRINGVDADDGEYTENPYRTGGWSIDAARLDAMLSEEENIVEVFL